MLLTKKEKLITVLILRFDCRNLVEILIILESCLLFFKLIIKTAETEVIDVNQKGIFDLYLTKYWGITYAVKAAISILYVDKLIMAKPAGGPKPKENKDYDNDD